MSEEMLIYISRAVTALSKEELQQIAAQSAHNNAALSITGLLMQVGNCFVQVLEGETADISGLLRKIEKDNRHTDVRVVFRAGAPGRLFARWNMGFFDIERHYLVSRLNLIDLKRTIHGVFESSGSRSEAVVEIIKNIPQLMEPSASTDAAA